MARKQDVLAEALTLPPEDRAALIEELLESISEPDRELLDRLWAAEAEDRIKAFERGDFEAIPMEEVFKNLGKRSGQ